MTPSLKAAFIFSITALACSSPSSSPEDSTQPIDEGTPPIEDTQSMDLGAEDSSLLPNPDIPSTDPGTQDVTVAQDTAPPMDSATPVDTAPPAPCPANTFVLDDECVPCPEGYTSEEDAESCYLAPVQGHLSTRDYGFLFWPTNHWFQWNVFFNEHYLQTGYYGMAIDVSEARIVRLGILEEEVSAQEAHTQSKSVIDNLPNASVAYSVLRNGVEHPASSFLNSEGGTSNPSRMIDMGRFMQRIEIPRVLYSGGSALNGSIQLAAMPRHFVLSHRLTNDSSTEAITLTLSLSAEALSGLNEITWLDGERALKIEGENIPGWTFIIPEIPGATPQIIVESNGTLRFTNSFNTPQAGQSLKLPVIAVPSNAGSDEQLEVWLNPNDAAQVQYNQLYLDGTDTAALESASWDPERGAFVVALKNLSQAGAPGGQSWADPNTHNWYNRHRLVLQNNTEGRVSIPIAFEGGNNAAFYIVGGSPLLRDTNGEPIGAPIQISKNWHEDPFWYHLYTQLEVDPGSHELEHTFAHSKWGEAFAAAHAQLSLIGWGQNQQQWDESSLGAFGETITYDPDYTLGRAMVDDVRPFLVQSKNLWSWTGNVGGADFLVYATNAGENFAGHQLGRLRTHYQYTGPNLTNVLYSGISRDQKIEARISTQLGRTDDLVRAYYHLEYTFLEDVNYHRLALFQMASDRYADNGFARYAFGNEAGVIFDQDILNHDSTGYAADTDRGIAIPGESPWVMLYNSQLTGGNLPEHLANIGFVIRDYHLQIGDEIYTTPHINIVRTNNQQKSQMAFEVGLPYDSSNTVIPAGSVLKATVEYLIPPALKSAYYGPSDHLAALPASSFEDTQMMLHLASGNDLEVESMIGSLVRTHPLEFEAGQEDIALHFGLTGGLGYTPLTIRGLARPDGWRLERKNGETWEKVDQSVHGNDYWQAYEASDSGRFDLIFNLKNQGTQEYRLTR